ncbi:hypothetical protein LMG28614_02569 [Paraburkholderia ultramafica]|uniref:Porin domain-containing protein n=1 Tax=Paraburkholderia ultramafica TaxID=1544867 RepID=A0A6S7CEB1_9BURK|nr:porin [Paraburkholderia ultramafica]CAB3787780.1 hypothetical protein LMG28614_02569 [Paraburkholderia ultramafica]
MRLHARLVAAPAVASPLAYGQTSVTLYGRLDGGIEYLNHINDGAGGSASRWSAEGGDWGTSMLGLKGNEDLGGGLNAIFNLETGLQVMNGTTYNLSKRTFLYGTVGCVRNSSNSNFSLEASPRNSTSNTSPLVGESQTGAYVGMLHQF